MPSGKGLGAVSLLNPVTSHQWARFCCQDFSCEVRGTSCVAACVTAAGSGPVKGVLDVIREGAAWRFSHETGFRWKTSASRNPDFSWEPVHHMQQKWYSWSQWEKGETKKNKERRGKNSSVFQTQECECSWWWDAEVLCQWWFQCKEKWLMGCWGVFWIFNRCKMSL